MQPDGFGNVADASRDRSSAAARHDDAGASLRNAVDTRHRNAVTGSTGTVKTAIG
jgi:hypothetical protein